MNRYTLILTILLLMFSSPSYSEWTKVTEGTEGGVNLGNTYYIDLETIKKVDGYVYFWALSDLLKPSPAGRLSNKMYVQGDCKLFRFKFLSFSHHNEPMGGGIGEVSEPIGEIVNWHHPMPNSVLEDILKFVCSR